MSTPTYPTTTQPTWRMRSFALALAVLVVVATALALAMSALDGTRTAPAPSTGAAEQQVPVQWLIEVNGPYGSTVDHRPIPRNIR
jgi:ABC-type glycerol-3-phosphate transport system substrate-binding protein